MPSTHPFDPTKAAEDLRSKLVDLEKSLAGTVNGSDASVATDIRELFGTLIEALPLCFAIISPEGATRYVNGPGCAMLKIDPAAARGMGPIHFFSPETYDTLVSEGFAGAQRRGHWNGDGVLQRQAEIAELPVSLLVTAHRK